MLCLLKSFYKQSLQPSKEYCYCAFYNACGVKSRKHKVKLTALLVLKPHLSVIYNAIMKHIGNETLPLYSILSSSYY